jgi:hypothetical protein
MRRRLLSEAKKDLDLAVVKCLTGGRLTPQELYEVTAITQADLIRAHGCDLYMAEKVKQHAKQEQYRLRAQNQFTKIDGMQNTGYPKKPYTRTDPIAESVLKEDHGHFESSGGGRMLDYGRQKSDSDEGFMMKSFLMNIAKNAKELHDMLQKEDDLPEWCHYKVAQAQGMIQSVRNYIEYDLKHEDHGHHSDMSGMKQMAAMGQLDPGFEE